jgi:uncharacterized repeat protein (TIGR03803 family)
VLKIACTMRRELSGSVCWSIVLLGLLWHVTAGDARAQTEKVLYTFVGGQDGGSPEAGLTWGAKGTGTLYGTTVGGGVYGYGTVFEISPTGTENVLYSFTGGADGGGPQFSLIRDPEGNLYGTSETKNFNGNVFEVTPDGVETVLHNFQGGPDGLSPQASLFRDSRGNLYGTTQYGGASTGSPDCNIGCGTVFEITASGEEKVLYSFTGGTDGGFPLGGVLLAAGDLYGTTNAGGTGSGTIFKLTLNGKESVLHTFAGGIDGELPYGNLIRDEQGNLYGTTSYGGSGSSNCPAGSGCGTVYELSPTGVKTVLYNFDGPSDGYGLGSGVVRDASGNLYGTTSYGGDSDCGTVFGITPTGEEILIYGLPCGKYGLGPYYGVILNGRGDLYGTTNSGGSDNCGDCGVVFKLKP